jgi:uncharacterized Zn finger protein (UPF0148 family)
MLSRDCDGCGLRYFGCERRFQNVKPDGKVYCPNGEAHLVDSGSV